MYDRDLMQSYLNYSQPIGSTKRYGKCPFCGPIRRLGFVVTRTTTGFVCWCHGCHKSYGIGGSTPSYRECLRVSGELKARMIQNPRKRKQAAESQTVTKSSVHLPFDITNELPTSALVWLRMFGVTQQEIQKYGLCWSPKYDRLVLPVRDENGKLVYWQGRYFGPEKGQPKYINTRSSRGNIWFDTGGDSQIIVLVEDILSALAVSRTGKARAIALLGSFISDNLIVKLLSEGRQVCVWLDRDKRCESIAFTKRLNVFGITAKTISTIQDPKCYKPVTISKEISHAYPDLFQHCEDNCPETFRSPALSPDETSSGLQPGQAPASAREADVRTDERSEQKLRKRHLGLAATENPSNAELAFPEGENGGFCLLQRDACIPERSSVHQQASETSDLILERLLVAGYLFRQIPHFLKAPALNELGR